MATSDWLDAIDRNLDTLSAALPLWTDAAEPRHEPLRIWRQGWETVHGEAAAHDAGLIEALAAAVLAVLGRVGAQGTALTDTDRRGAVADALEQALASLAALVADHDVTGSGQDTAHVQVLIARLNRIAVDLAEETLAALRSRVEALTEGLAAVEQSLTAVSGRADWLRDRVFALGDALDLRMVARSGQVARPGQGGEAAIDREQVEALGQGLDTAIRQLLATRATLTGQVAALVAAVAAQRALLDP